MLFLLGWTDCRQLLCLLSWCTGSDLNVCLSLLTIWVHCADMQQVRKN